MRKVLNLRPERVIAYVDGFNLYFGLREKGWRRYYWLNVQLLMRNLLHPGQQLLLTKYFTSRVSFPPDKLERQELFLEALGTLTQFEIYYGKYLFNERSCRTCGHTVSVASEKMSDVNIAVQLMLDAFDDRFDMALLVSADSDLVPPVRAVRQRSPDKRIVVAFPPARFSVDLANHASGHFTIGRAQFAKSLFPPQVTSMGGYVLRRPERWR